MIKWYLQNSTGRALGARIIVALAVTEPEDKATYTITAEGTNTDAVEGTIAEIRSWLEVATGLRGHIISKRPTAVELDAALHSKRFAEFAPRIIEGQELAVPSASQFVSRIAEAEALGLHT
jgi:hypothetical protein